MSTNKHIDKICCVILVLTLIVSVIAMGLGAFDDLGTTATGYELKLFDDTYVHTIEIVMDDWDGFLSTCENEEYASCSVIIDNESFKNVAIRAKGNTSLSSVSQYGNNRYSFKIEFDHYDTSTYHGLDKLSLNNVIQDNTYMKDYLVYTLMREHGVSAPLCSFVNIVVNGEDFGVYLAVEGIEDSFLQRNYGTDYGELYKPDSMSMGGGRGNGKDFSEDALNEFFSEEDSNSVNASADTQSGAHKQGFGGRFQMPTDETGNAQMPEIPTDENGNIQMPEMPTDEDGNVQMPEGSLNGGFDRGNMGGGFGNGSNDVLLKYTDDSYSSYQNIFDSAKTDITDADKDRLIESLKALNEGTEIQDCVDIEAVISYFVVHNFVCNFDSYTGQMIHNYYLYEKDGVMSMLPWDYNLAFGGFMSGSSAQSLVNFPIDSPVSGGNAQDRPMIAWIFNSEEYTELYHKSMSEFINNIFSSGYFEEKFDSVTEMLEPFVEKDPTSFCTYEEFVAGTAALREFCLLRAESVEKQLSGVIPSTSEGQAEDSSGLVDAGELNINDMGSMGMGGKGGFGGGNGDFGRFNKQATTDASQGEDATQTNAEPSFSTSSDNGFTNLSINSLFFINSVVEGVTDSFAQGGGFFGSGMGGRPQGDMGNMTPPQMPNGEFPQGEMSQMPNGELPQGEMPQMPNGEFPQGEAPQMTNGEFPQNNVEESVANENSLTTDVVEEPSQETEENTTEGTVNDNFQKPQRDDAFVNVGTQESKGYLSTESVLGISVSLGVLIFGLIFAKKFRRYKY